MTQTNEAAFETVIEAHLLANGTLADLLMRACRGRIAVYAPDTA